tara:strand:+ start:131 stop:835 length:705 start_codon:yes stop_codon:yes gene_type:complete
VVLSKVSVVCVKWGTLYSDDYVRILQAMVERNTTKEYEFVCFSDTEIEGVQTKILPKGLDGWWNKLVLFDNRYNLNERIVYFDLDTAITANVDWLLDYRGEIMGIENLGTANYKYENVDQYRNVFQAGVLAWDYKAGNDIWNWFDINKEEAMKRYRGDGEMLHGLLDKPDLLQHLYPNQLRSYKYECYDEGLIEGTSIVCFHGEPNPHQAISETVHPWGTTFEPREWVSHHWCL